MNPLYIKGTELSLLKILLLWTPFLLTLLTIRFSILQVKGVVPDWLLTGSTHEAIDMPCLFQGINYLLNIKCKTQVIESRFVYLQMLDKLYYFLSKLLEKRINSINESQQDNNWQISSNTVFFNSRMTRLKKNTSWVFFFFFPPLNC